MTDDEIRAHLEQNSISLWVLCVEGAPAGYFELMRYDDGSIACFGLLPEFLGQRLGALQSIALGTKEPKGYGFTHALWITLQPCPII
jgi:hypothetical protein